MEHHGLPAWQNFLRRRERHRNRGRAARALTVLVGAVLVTVGILIAPLPGPGPVVLVPLGLSMLALEFEWAEKLFGRALLWAHRVRQAPPRHQRLMVAVGVVALLTTVGVALVWDVPGLPV